MKHIKRDFLSKACVSHPLGGLRVWGQNSTFSEHGHVAYQIKGNHECSSMVANILVVDPFPPPPPQRCAMVTKSLWSCCIKLKGILNASTW